MRNILRKGNIKNWIVKSALGLAGGLALFGVSQSTVTQAATDTGEQPSSTEIASETVTKESEPAVGEIIDSGTWGTVDWDIKREGTDVILRIHAGTLDNVSYDYNSHVNVNPWSDADKEIVTKIEVDGKVIAGEDISGLFMLFTNVTQISGLNNLETSNTTNMANLFDSCNKLNNIDISELNVSKVTNFSRMFYEDYAITSIILPSGPSSKEDNIDFSSMFSLDKSLKSLDLSNLDMSRTDKVVKLLYWNSSLSELKLSSQNNLTGTDLYLDSTIVGDEIQGYSGWKKNNDSNVNLKSYELSEMYDGKTDNGETATWSWNKQPYLSFTVRYVDKDSGKLLGTRQVSKSDHKLPFSEFQPSSVLGLVTEDSGYAINYIPNPVTLTKEMDGKFVDVKIPKAAVNFEIHESGKSNPYYISITQDDLNNGEIDFKGKLDVLKDKEMILSTDDTEEGRESYFQDGDTKINLTEELLETLGVETHNLKDLIRAFVSLSTNYNTSIPQGDKEITFVIHAVYEPEKNTNSGGSSSSGGPSSTTVNREVEGIEETIGTHKNNPDVQLYDDNGEIIKDRKLAPSSDWYTDSLMTLKGVKYYRVATDLWAKADDIYVYYPNTTNVIVNKDSIANLVTSQGKDVTDRALQESSGWFTDRYTYINNVKYYRVATNEFVSADKVQEY